MSAADVSSDVETRAQAWLCSNGQGWGDDPRDVATMFAREYLLLAARAAGRENAIGHAMNTAIAAASPAERWIAIPFPEPWTSLLAATADVRRAALDEAGGDG